MSLSSPSARAPPRVAMASTCAEGNRLASVCTAFWNSEAYFMTSNMSLLLLQGASSVPSPRLMPAAR